MRRWCVAVAIGVVSLGAAPVAVVGATEPTAAERLTARSLAQSGARALERRDYRTAEEAFTRADALVHAPTLLLGIARAQVGLGKLVEAHETYARIVREGVEPNAPESWSRALEQARVESTALAPRLPWLVLTVRPSPPGMQVTIDGQDFRRATLGVRTATNPGRHPIEVRADGY